MPYSHTVTVTSNGGRVALDGAFVSGETQVERHKEQTYRIIPDAGKQVDKVLYNGEDVTDKFESGVFTAPKLTDNATLTVTYKSAPAAPDSRTYEIGGKVTDENGNPVAGATVEIGGKTAMTDDKGEYSLKDVSSGSHTAVVTDKDGKLLGTREVTIEKAADSFATREENGVLIITPGKNTKELSLDFKVQSSGALATSNVKDATPSSGKPGDGKTPQTGDDSHVALWLVLLAVSGAGILATVYGRKKKRI